MSALGRINLLESLWKDRLMAIVWGLGLGMSVGVSVGHTIDAKSPVWRSI